MLLLDKSSAASFLLQDPVSPTWSPSPWSTHRVCWGGAQERPCLTLEYLTQGLLKIMCKKNRDCHLSLYPSVLTASLLHIQTRDSSLYNLIKAALLLSVERTSVFICPHARHFRNATDLWCSYYRALSFRLSVTLRLCSKVAASVTTGLTRELVPV